MQLGKREIRLLILLGCLLSLTASYMFGYKKYGEMRDKNEQELKQLTIKYDELNKKNSKREEYLKKTKENKENKDKILQNYPCTDTVENEIYFTKLLENNTKAKIKSFSFAEPETFYVDNETGAKTGITGYCSVSTVSFSSDYEQFKKTLNYIHNAKQRRVINTMTLSVDKMSGKLAGTITYNNYYLEGTGIESVPEAIRPSSQGVGVDNIFGSLVKDK